MDSESRRKQRLHPRDLHQKPDIQLCNVCRKLSFSKDYEPGPGDYPDYEEAERPFGQIQDIRKKPWCPFCRLVISDLLDAPEQNYFVGAETEIHMERIGEAYTLLESKPGNQIWFVADCYAKNRSKEAFKVVSTREIDFSQVKKWLQTCETYHRDMCRPLSQAAQSSIQLAALSPLRVVDVRRNCVVEMPLHGKYLTLSYVWGEVPSVRLTKRNLKQLMTDDSLDNTRVALPRTILDALDFVSRLGEQYIWIDTCA